MNAVRSLVGQRAVLAVAFCLGVAGRQPVPFRAATRLVVLHVIVTNKSGGLVTNLDRSAFDVYEDGHHESIALFGRDDAPVSLGLVIDNSASMRSLRARVESAALAFVQASNAADEVFVVNFADTARLDVPFTGDHRILEAGIARVDSIGGTALRDAILLADGYMREHASRDRRALLVVTDGNDNASSVTASELRRRVERDGASLYAIRLVHVPPAKDEGHGEDDLARLSEVTGGAMRYCSSMMAADSAVLEIARRIRNEYTIAYAPANQSLDGSYRVIKVKVTAHGGLVAHTRPGYWAHPLPSNHPSQLRAPPPAEP